MSEKTSELEELRSENKAYEDIISKRFGGALKNGLNSEGLLKAI